MPRIGVIVGKFARLIGDSLDDLLAAIPNVHAIEAGKSVQQPVAVAVLNVNAFTTGHDATCALSARMLRKVGGGVHEGLPVPPVKHIVRQGIKGHEAAPWSDAGQRKQATLGSLIAATAAVTPSRPTPD